MAENLCEEGNETELWVEVVNSPIEYSHHQVN